MTSLFVSVHQLLNFAFVPLYVRTTFTGCCAFVWATFLCFSRQSGDGTAAAALAWMLSSKAHSTEVKDEKEASKGDQTGSKDNSAAPKAVKTET